MRGKPTIGSMRRMICGGLYTRSNRSKFGAKSETRTLAPFASVRIVSTIAVLRT